MRNYLTINRMNEPFDFIEEFFNTSSVNRQVSVMATNAKKNEQGILLEIEIPGFKKEELSVDYKDEYLTVSARRELSDEKKKEYFKVERYNGLTRTYFVGKIDENGINAKYQDGVLYIELPFLKKKEEVKKIVIE